MEGLHCATGNLFATMDGDGQNNPADLPLLLNEIKTTDVDMVVGWREDRQDHWSRRFVSYYGNKFRNLLTREVIRDTGCSLKVFHWRCVQNAPVFGGMHRYLPTIARMNGYGRIREVAVTHRNRKFGRSKYGLPKRILATIADSAGFLWIRRRMDLRAPSVAKATIDRRTLRRPLRITRASFSNE